MRSTDLFLLREKSLLHDFNTTFQFDRVGQRTRTSQAGVGKCLFFFSFKTVFASSIAGKCLANVVYNINKWGKNKQSSIATNIPSASIAKIIGPAPASPRNMAAHTIFSSFCCLSSHCFTVISATLPIFTTVAQLFTLWLVPNSFWLHDLIGSLLFLIPLCGVKSGEKWVRNGFKVLKLIPLTPQMFRNEPQASEAQQRTTQRTYASVIKPCAPQIDMVSIKTAVEDLSWPFLVSIFLVTADLAVFYKVPETSVLSFISFTTNCRRLLQLLPQIDKKIRPFKDHSVQ